MKCLVVGYGSIGKRHADILQELEHIVHVVSRRNVHNFPRYKTIPEALGTSEFDYVVICNETVKHYDSFVLLTEIGYCGKKLIEKPLFHKIPEFLDLDISSTYVAYQLRFHSVILKMLQLINSKRLHTVHVYVGQYLPDWRPGTEYSKSYSASRDNGGGVLRDLSHDLDYVTWFAGRWKRVAAIGGKVSDLSIDSDDVFSLLLETERCSLITVQMNYLDRLPRREITINLDDGTLKGDLINNTLEINGKLSRIDVERNKPYRDMHQAVLTDDLKYPCSFREGIEIVKLIECAEAAAKNRKWVYR